MDTSKKITLTPEIKELQGIFKKAINTLHELEKEHDQLINEANEKK